MKNSKMKSDDVVLLSATWNLNLTRSWKKSNCFKMSLKNKRNTAKC